MTKENLLRQLEQLRQELLTIGELDRQSTASLQCLLSDIQNLLEQPDRYAAPDEAEAKSLRDQIERFESEHPAMTRFLSQLTESLASLGI